MSQYIQEAIENLDKLLAGSNSLQNGISKQTGMPEKSKQGACCAVKLHRKFVLEYMHSVVVCNSSMYCRKPAEGYG